MPPPKEEGELLVATADGKGVPMRRLADPAASPCTAHRRGKGEKANQKQMSYVGAVYSIARFPRTVDQILDELLRKQRAKNRPRPQHKRVWAEMTRPGDGVLEGMLLHGPSYLFAGLAVECQARNPAREESADLFNGWRKATLGSSRRVARPGSPDLGLVPRERAALDGGPLLSCRDESRGRAICRVLLADAVGRQSG